MNTTPTVDTPEEYRTFATFKAFVLDAAARLKALLDGDNQDACWHLVTNTTNQMYQIDTPAVTIIFDIFREDEPTFKGQFVQLAFIQKRLEDYGHKLPDSNLDLFDNRCLLQGMPTLGWQSGPALSSQDAAIEWDRRKFMRLVTA